MSNRKPLLNLLMLCLIAVLLGACGGSSATPAPTETTAPFTKPMQPEAEDVSYSTSAQPNAQGRVVDVYMPASVKDGPVVVFITGGEGSRENYAYQALVRATAERGAVVFFPDYPFEKHPKQRFSENNGAALREDIENTLCAIRFARANAAKYGAKSDKVIVVSHMWGGYLSLLAALAGDDIEQRMDVHAAVAGGPLRQVECVAGEGVSGRPDAMIGYSGAYLILNEYKDENPDLFALVDPNAYAGNKTDIPLRFVEGERHNIQPEWHVALSEQLYQSLLDAGHDIARPIANAADDLSEPAREAIVKMLAEMINP